MDTIQSIKYSAAPIKGGCTDAILHINLDSLSISTIDVDKDFRDKYTGGRGYALKLIWDMTSAKTRYDSPENVLVMAGGPLCNESRFPGSGKFIVGTISPLTGTFMDSNVGGFFAPILKTCGFDALAVSGIAKEPVIIIIDDNLQTLSIAKAPSYGNDIDSGGVTYGESLLNDYTNNNLHKNIAAVTTGIGAQYTNFGLVNSHFYDSNRSRLRTKQAGRGGTGTVMRFKKLMGVIVNSSNTRTKKNNPIDRDSVNRAGKALAQVINKEDPKQLHLASWGTPVLVEYMNKFHILPINNYQKGQDEKAKAVFSNVFLDQYLKVKRPDGCYAGCNLACAKGAEEVTLIHGPGAGKTVNIDGPEYETVGAVTCMGIFDPQFTMEYNWYCDEYGMDTISMGVSASFLMECYQRGYLTIEDTGYPLEFGSIDSADRIIHETAHGQGIGAICGKGIAYSKKWIAEKHSRRNGQSYEDVLEELNTFAMEVKGLEFSMYITKESLAQQGGYGFALKGPQHDEAWLIFLDQVHKEMETFEMKTAALLWFPLIRTWFNAVGLCKLPWIDVRHPEAADTENPAQNMPTFKLYVDYLNGTTGTNKSVEDILLDSERLHLLQKLINLRQGKGTREFDQIPERAMGPVFEEEYNNRASYYDTWLQDHDDFKGELPESSAEKLGIIKEIRKKAFSTLCDTVYKAKGYDKNAIPLPDTIKKHDLYDEKAKNLLDAFFKPGPAN